MTTCGACGQENPAGFRFCGNCGAPLADERWPEREERKVVTVLFADLVGFTSEAEQLDPEDVRSILAGYHARLRGELERHGGTVEKFIGDAVMALFGAPVAHEDDPERAVRAALAIRDALADERASGGRDLHVRIGITTGEALVSLGVRPEAGEGMAAGDVVNTAARLQSAAPTDGVLVDAATFRATERRIDYHPAEPVQAKGKAEPVPVWEAIEGRSRLGADVARSARTPLVGRSHETAFMRELLARARRDREPQLVTLIGVPGIGKSRLVYELLQAVEADPAFVVWRQGRCLPYGEGGSYRALGDVVKAQAGILESDDDAEALAKLRRAVQTLLPDADEALRVERHLRPLAGLEAAGAERGQDSFASWRRFVEALAEEQPAVLVLEDLHWADDSLLDFVEHLVEWAAGVPLLIVCVARPELLSRRPGWGGGKPNASTLSLSPLADDELARLVGLLLEQAVMPADVQAALLARAGGNPLYAEELLRMAAETGDGVLEAAALPPTVQAIIAARLDGLEAEDKELLSNAAVIGKVFWLGALTSGAARRDDAERRLRELERRQLVRRERRTSVAGEAEYSFWHVLIRDVAYGQIPRGARGRKHRHAAEWIASLAPDRLADRADLLAHHYTAALELARATGEDTADIEQLAREALRAAGERAAALGSFVAAERHFRDALALWPGDAPGRGSLLLAHGRTRLRAYDEGGEEFVAARAALLDEGDAAGAAEAETLLGEFEWMRGRTEQALEYAQTAARRVEGLPASASTTYVLGNLARYLMIAGRSAEAIEPGRAALGFARELGLEDREAAALNALGTSRVNLGDRGGLDDLRASIALAERIGSYEAVRSYINLASTTSDLGDLNESRRLHERGHDLARQLGDLRGLRFIEAELAVSAFLGGDWDDAASRIEAFLAGVAGTPHYYEGIMRLLRGMLAVARGEKVRGLEEIEGAADHARTVTKEPQTLLPTFAAQALACADTGDAVGAGAALDEIARLVTPAQLHFGAPWIYPAALAFDELGRLDELSELLGAEAQSRWHEAFRLHAAGDLPGAADELASIGSRTDEARLRLRAAERGGPDAREQLERALAFYRSVGATLYLRRGERLLPASA